MAQRLVLCVDRRLTGGRVGGAASLGPAVRLRAACVSVLLLITVAAAAGAEQRYQIIVTGATGGAAYAQQYAKWTQSLSQTLIERMKFDPARVTVLSETADETRAATAASMRRIMSALRRQMQTEDLLFVLLIGHGTFDGVDAKFNLVGPDLGRRNGPHLRGMPGRLVVVNSAAASFPFIERLSGARRVVISATDSVAQQFDTVFPEYFVEAFREEAGTRRQERAGFGLGGVRLGGRRRAAPLQQRAQLATERSLLDDNGDGVGREAAAQGEDGSLSSRTYLDSSAAGAPPTDEVLVELLQRRAALEAEAEELQVKKQFMGPDEHSREARAVMIALARVSNSRADERDPAHRRPPNVCANPAAAYHHHHAARTRHRVLPVRCGRCHRSRARRRPDRRQRRDTADDQAGDAHLSPVPAAAADA